MTSCRPFARYHSQIVAAATAVAFAWNVPAAVLPPADPSLDSWTAKLVAGRPGLPPLETRSPQAGSVDGNPAAVTLKLLGACVAGAPPAAVAPAAPRVLALDPDNQVYAMVFTAVDGSRQEFATHLRPDDTRPLYLRASGYAPAAGAGFEQARAALVERVLGGNTAGLSIGGRTTLVDSGKLALRAGQKTIEPPWSEYWVFFIDDKPMAGWEHPCRYVFMAPDLSSLAVQYGRSVLELFDLTQAGQPRVLLSTVVANPVSDTPQPLWVPPPGVTNYLNLNLEGSAKNCYAVILSGGANDFNNWQRYWEDSANIYSTLKHKYGFTDDHIIALISDGTNPANDRNIGTRDDPVYANSPTDLDGDGDVDTDGACTYAQVQAAFNSLAGVLTANDQLFVFITDHGYQESGHDAGVNLWNWENLRDDQLADMTQDLPCPVMFALETCYSGGFVDDITATANRVIGTACAYNDTSEGWSHYDPWVYYLTAAVRGYYPAAPPANPWIDGAVCNADTSGDGRVSFNEAWTHAWNNRAASDVPQLGENPAGLGNSLYMNQLQVELNNNVPVGYSQIPKDFSFQVLSSGWAAVGVASASDHDIKADDNRQLTTPYRSSSLTGSLRDFVVVNGHRIGNATHYAQVYYGAASAYNVEAEWLPTDLTIGSSPSYTASANEVFDLAEIYLYAGTSYDATIHITSGTPDLGLYVYTPASDNGSRSSANWSRNAGGAGVDETLTFRPTTSGSHGIVMVNDNGGSGGYTITFTESPPLAAPTGVAATDGTYSDRVRVTWNSVALATHYQVYRNTVNASGSATLVNDWTAGLTFDDLTATAGRTYYYCVKAAATVDGDRESAFSASASGYVLPTTLTSESRATTVTEPAYYRAGGITVSNHWWAVGVRRNVTNENWSLRLYDTPGFVTQIESSAYTWPVDLVVIDGNHDGSVYHGVEAYRFSGSGTASVEYEGTDTAAEILAVNTNSTWSWTAGDVVEMFEVPLVAGTYRFTLNVTSGTADLDFALFGSSGGDYYRNRENYLARSVDAIAGADESFIYTVTTADNYGLCLWANDANSASYTLSVDRITSGIWTGTVSTNWFTAGNWQGSVVPTAVLDATIPAGTPFSPTVGGGSATCSNLVIATGATLAISSNSTLVATRDVHVNGLLRMKYGTAKLDTAGSIYWHAGSTADIIGSWPDIQLDGILVLENGGATNLLGAHFQFYGSSPSYIRTFNPACALGWVENLKDATTFLGISGMCSAPCYINYLYNESGHTFTTFSDQELRIGFYIKNAGHLQLDQGVLAFTGVCNTNSPLTLMPGDYINDLSMRASGTLLLGDTYTNTFPILGTVELASGKLDGSLVDLQVGGSWSNFVGTAGFTPGNHKVTFNKANVQQNIHGTNLFYDLVDARSGSDQLLLRGPTTVQRNFSVNYQTAVWSGLDVQGTLVISNVACQLILWGSSDVQAAALNLGGELLVYSGSLVADNLLNNGLYGYIDIRGGQVTLTQGTASGDWFDLYGTINMTGGRLDLVGGGSDHYWPLSGACSFTMNGGVLDFHSQGWWIRSGFSGGITNGTLRCAENVFADTSAFAPVGGLLELYGPLNGQLRQAAGSRFPSLLVNKKGSARADVTTNLTITGSVEIRSGVLKAGTNTLSVSGNWTNGVGTAGFSEDTSTVRFVGNAAADIQTDETFYRVELAKTYAGFDGLEMGSTVRILNDLVITNGTLEMNSGSLLDVGRDVFIANGAGLNANDPPPMEIHIGRHWSNLNTNFSTVNGFDPGYNSLVVFDGATVSGDMSTAAAAETFNAVRIDRSGGTLRVLDALLLRNHLTILNGSLSYSGGPFTHRLRGDLIIEMGGAWYDTVSTVIFDGTAAQSLNNKSMAGWFKHMIVEKNTGIGIVPLTLQTNVLLLGGGTLTVREGYMDLNGHYVRCTGNVTVEDGGKLTVNAGAWVEVGNPGTLDVQGGGLLDVRGTTANPAKVTDWSGDYAFIIRSNAVLRAENAVFEGMDANGLWVATGAAVEEPFTFHGCTFRYGAGGGTLLRLDNSQVMTVRNAVFPSNAGGTASNVRKSVAAGRADFVHATGIFAGEAYDNDVSNLVNWYTGNLTQVGITGPSVVTKGGTYQFTATAAGDSPLTPIYYF